MAVSPKGRPQPQGGDGEARGTVEQREIVSRWIEDRAGEKDVPALAWLLHRCIGGLLRCYPSAGHAENSRMILDHVKTILETEG